MYGRYQLKSPESRYGQGLRAVLEMLAPEMRSAVLEANRAYAALGVTYALCGGLAAGAHGDPRLTKVVGKDRSDIVGMMRAGAVDLAALSAAVADDPELRRRLDEALAELAAEEENE